VQPEHQDASHHLRRKTGELRREIQHQLIAVNSHIRSEAPGGAYASNVRVRGVGQTRNVGAGAKQGGSDVAVVASDCVVQGRMTSKIMHIYRRACPQERNGYFHAGEFCSVV